MESINERKLSDKKDEKRDLLSNLVNANEEFLEDGEPRLDETELIGTRSSLVLRPVRLRVCGPGNMFIVYIAGHGVSIL